MARAQHARMRAAAFGLNQRLSSPRAIPTQHPSSTRAPPKQHPSSAQAAPRAAPINTRTRWY
eukprot:11211973-Lingulodinium_polyedra.AAC.1